MTFASFNKSVFDKASTAKFWDKTVIIPMDGDRLSEATLSDWGYQDHFSGYEVAIKSKINGTIAVHRFLFRDYLDYSDRIDTRKDYHQVGGFHAWFDSGSVDWYIAVPSKRNVQRLTDAIADYIRTYI